MVDMVVTAAARAPRAGSGGKATRWWWVAAAARAPVGSANMWRWAVLWQASTLLLVCGTLDFRYFDHRRQYAPPPQMNCFEYTVPVVTDRLGRALDKGWRPQNTIVPQRLTASTTATFPADPRLNLNEISRRIDHQLPGGIGIGNDIVKEHAKLVQDINSLRQVVFVAPLAEDHKDYDDSIFPEIIETSTTTTARPTTTRPIKPIRQTIKPNTVPVILLGGASQRQTVKSIPQLRIAKPPEFRPTINLVGTSASPLVKHPYPFVMQSSNQKPIKVCMTSMPMPTAMYAATTTRRPSFWLRLLSSLIPR